MNKKDLLPEITIGLTGHVDHGKTTITHALTGKWTMVHSEELKRGITIKLGYADASIKKCECKDVPYTIDDKCLNCNAKTEVVRKISFVDAPGHETLMAVMLSGAAIMDGAILVISATEEVPQPQTLEHLTALKILGIEKIIIVQNKVDLLTKDKAKENYEKIKEFVKETLGRDLPIIPISGQKKINIDVLVTAIQELIPTPDRNLKKDPIFMIARSFDVNKPGTDIENLTGGVLGGAIPQGLFKIGQEIQIKPGLKLEKKGNVTWKPINTKISDIFSGNMSVKEKGPGGSIALSTTLDPAITKSDSFVGNVAGIDGKLPPVVEDVELIPYLFEYVVGTKAKLKLTPFKQYELLMLNVGTATTIGIVQSSGKKLKLKLRRPVCVEKGSKIAIARQIQSRWHLIGYGVVL